jgi:Tfp pilus assembly protein PilN
VIKINLLPGGKKGSGTSRSFSLSLPSFGAGGERDQWVLGAVAAAVVGLGLMAFLWFSSSSAQEEVELALEEARRDSARFADIVERTELLQARSDSIIQRVSIIQEIDEGRYIWPHILDEVARALPEYTWLDQVVQVTEGAGPVRVRVVGTAGNNFALAVFMDQLEASPFLRDVSLVQSEQTVQSVAEGARQVVYSFEVEARYEAPPLDFLETVPLFDSSPEPLPDPAPAAGPAR